MKQLQLEAKVKYNIMYDLTKYSSITTSVCYQIFFNGELKHS